MAQNLETGLIINKLTGDTHTLTINGDVSVTGLTTDISLLKISQSVIGFGTISASQDLMDPLYSGYTRIDGVDTNFTTSVKINESIISSGLTLYIVDIISDTLLYTLLDPLAFFTGETYTLDGLTRLESFNNGNFIVDNKIYVGKGRNNFDLDTAIGYKALGGDDPISSLSTRNIYQNGQNTAIGYESNRYNGNGVKNTSIGYQALKGGGTDGNTVIGSGVMRDGAGVSNICIGFNSLNGNGGSYYNSNIGIGNQIMSNPSLGSNSNYSVLIGHSILSGTKYASENVAIGDMSLTNGIGAVTFDGGLTYQISGMTENTTLGTRTMYNSDLGYRNTAIGHESLYYITDAYENTAIGYKSGPPSLTYSGLTNTTCVGANSTVTKDNSVILGSPSDTNIMVGIGTSAPDDSAKLQVDSTTKGFLPPRMTGSQAEAISNPAEGLMVYVTNGNGSTITSKGWWGTTGTTSSDWVKIGP
jgi:hypothetical protein